MGFLSKVFKGIKKVVKGVAKGVKKLGSGIWKGVKGIAKGIGKAFTKLGPLAMIGASMIPGVGAFFSGMWNTFGSTMAGWSQAAGTLKGAVGTLGKGIFNGVNWIKGAAGSITETIGEGLKTIGSGEFKAGISKLGDTFSNAMAGGAQASRVGMATAQAQAVQTAAATTAAETAATDAFAADISAAINQPVGQTPFVASPLQTEAARQATVTGATQGFTASPLLTSGARQQAVTQAAVADSSRASLMDRALKAGSSLFTAADQQFEGQYIPGFTPDAPESQISAQVGSIGSASGGGSFLSERQLRGYQDYWNSSLGIGRQVGGTV